MKELNIYSSVESVKASIRHELNRVNNDYTKRGKLLHMQRERNYYDALEMKPMGEQMKIIRFSKNSNQRFGVKTLDHEKLDECSRYFASMLSLRDGLHYDQQIPFLTNTTSQVVRVSVVSVEEFDKVSAPFSPAVIERFLKRAKNGKAAGCSGVVAELLKPVPFMVSRVLALITEIMYCTGLCPAQFQDANITPIPKKTNSNDVRDSRPISLTEVLRRTIEKCLALSMKPFERALSPMQGGFR